MAGGAARRLIAVSSAILLHFSNPQAIGPTAAAAVSFAAPRDFLVGGSPVSVAVADFNGDGRLDVATANVSTDTVSILSATGGGLFGASVEIAVDSKPFAVVSRDFNRDLRADLIVANAGSNNLSILLGNGDGTFRPPLVQPVGNSPRSLTSGDFNADGRRDLAVANALANTVSILLGRGDGSFIPVQTAAVGSFPTSIGISDFNRDGAQDLVVANYVSASLSVLLGSGNGTFQNSLTVTTLLTPYSVAIGDFNRDLKPDIALARLGYQNYVGGMTLHLGAGDGTFAPAVDVIGSHNFAAVSVGDFNGDFKADVVAAMYPPPGQNDQTGTSFLLLGDGSGGFPTRHRVDLSAAPTAIAVGDVNNDHRMDVVAADVQGGAIAVRIGTGIGTFEEPAAYLLGHCPTAVAASDWNVDGATDILAETALEVFLTGPVTSLLNTGDGRFGSPIIAASGGIVGPVADFDGDGIPDFATWGRLWHGNGDGTFRLGATFPTPAPDEQYPLAAADWNGDGQQDLLVFWQNFFFGNTVSMMFGNGDGTFRLGGPISATASIVVGDLNRDGDVDLVSRRERALDLYLGIGDGTFEAPVVIFASSATLTSPALGDFDADGNFDIAVGMTSSGIQILLGNGDGSFRNPVGVPVEPENTLLTADFNADGKHDLAFVTSGRSGAPGRVTVLASAGDGTFQPPVLFGGIGGAFYTGVVAEDLNGDGKPDLVGVAPCKVAVLLNTTP